MKLLGIDNVLFSVGDLDATIEHYRRLGFELRFGCPIRRSRCSGSAPSDPGS